jgi:hypothetical protein
VRGGGEKAGCGCVGLVIVLYCFIMAPCYCTVLISNGTLLLYCFVLQWHLVIVLYYFIMTINGTLLLYCIIL